MMAGLALVTLSQAAKALGVSKNHIERLVHEAECEKKSRWKFGKEIIDLTPMNSVRRTLRINLATIAKTFLECPETQALAIQDLIKRQKMIEQIKEKKQVEGRVWNAGYVYLLKHPKEDLYKIGFSSDKNIKTRLQTLRSKKDLDLIDMIHDPRAFELEQMLHKTYAAYRLPQSEWFLMAEEPGIKWSNVDSNLE